MYEANAKVYHSHHLGFRSEFSRYFDIAVHHNRERWIIDSFGSVGGEGLSFVRSEMRYLRNHAPRLIPLALLRDLEKLVAYQCGLRQHRMPLWVKRAFSEQTAYWREERSNPDDLSPLNEESANTLRKLIR